MKRRRGAPRVAADFIFAGDYRLDPHGPFRRMREIGPILFSDEADAWVVTHHRDVADAFTAPEMNGDRLAATFSGLSPADCRSVTDLEEVLESELSFAPQSAHDQIRRAIDGRLFPHHLRSFGPVIEDSLATTLDAITAGGAVDLVQDFAEPFTERVLARTLGVRELPPDLSELAEKMHGLHAVPTPSIVDLLAAQGVVRQIVAIIASLITDPSSPGPALFATLDHAADRGELEDVANLAAVKFQLSRTAHAPSTLIGLVLWRLARDPGEGWWKTLSHDRPLVPAFIEEVLRLEPPSLFTTRVAATPFSIAGVDIEVGERVILAVAAANRDADVFAEPDALDLERHARHEPEHLSFSAGSHICPGQHLGRLETALAVNAILDQFTELEIDTADLRWVDNPRFRQLQSLPAQTAVRSR